MEKISDVNPKLDHDLCNIAPDRSYHYICDPDKLLTMEQVRHVDAILQSVSHNTSTLCTNVFGDKEGFVASIFLVDHIRVPDLSTSQTCTNDCGQIHPTLNTTTRTPTDQEINVAVENFAYRLRLFLGMGTCDNDVIIFYARSYNAIATSVGGQVSHILTSSKVTSVNDAFISDVTSMSLYESLVNAAGSYLVVLRSITPAYIMLTVNLVGLLLMSLYLPLSFYFKPSQLYVWDDNSAVNVAKTTFYWLTGLWVFELVFTGMFYIQERLAEWVMVVVGVIAVTCVVVSVLVFLSIIQF